MLALAASISGVPWSVICMIISLILLFIAAFFVEGVGTRPRISFGWAGMFFLALALAIA